MSTPWGPITCRCGWRWISESLELRVRVERATGRGVAVAAGSSTVTALFVAMTVLAAGVAWWSGRREDEYAVGGRLESPQPKERITA